MSAHNFRFASLDHALRALELRDPPNLHRYPSVPAADEPAPYRGAQYGHANSGDEWLRLAELRVAGQMDMFSKERE